ncbi:hypothetical protein [Achromobacter aloeverae]
MVLSNEQVWDELENIRLRQVPWHKKPAVFSALQTLGLIVPAPQQILSNGNRPAVQIAVLTGEGKAELERLAGYRHAAEWARLRGSEYAYAGRGG